MRSFLLARASSTQRADRTQERAPVLLTSGSHLGTLAAVRALGRWGIPIVLAESSPLCVSNWSRFPSARVRSPNIREQPEAFLEWLLGFGKKSPVRPVLLPTCDDTAWLYARHRAELARFFCVSSCSLDAVYGLLNKARLTEACHAVGIATPRTHVLSSDADLERIAAEGSFPLLIKPPTQVMFASREKGEVIRSRHQLCARYREFQKLTYWSPLLSTDPSVRWPLVQEYFAHAPEEIYNLSGYVGPNATDSIFRASTKVLQEREVGIGLCFEAASVDRELAAAVRQLFARLSYHGIFELEFIPARGKYHLIDANPRFYGEMAFDIARGMPLPLLAYHDALGDEASVRELIERAEESPQAPHAHTHQLAFELHLRTKRFSGALSPEQDRRWRDWCKEHAGRLSDAVYDPSDQLPSLFDATNSIFRQLRFPSELLKQTLQYRLGRGAEYDR